LKIERIRISPDWNVNAMIRAIIILKSAIFEYHQIGM